MKTTVAIVGLGSRGRVTYAPIAKQYPDLMEITALADINPACVEEAAKEYNVPKERCFTSAEELLAQPKLADAIFICTQDQDHVREALVALEKGYHILMEKPISPSAEDCNKLLEASRKYDRKIVVCHVLRYTPFFSKIKEIISEGTIGDVVTIQAIENVGIRPTASCAATGETAIRPAPCVCRRPVTISTCICGWRTRRQSACPRWEILISSRKLVHRRVLRFAAWTAVRQKKTVRLTRKKFISPTSVPASHRATPNGRLTFWQFIRQRKASMKRSRQDLTDAVYFIATTTL